MLKVKVVEGVIEVHCMDYVVKGEDLTVRVGEYDVLLSVYETRDYEGFITEFKLGVSYNADDNVPVLWVESQNADYKIPAFSSIELFGIYVRVLDKEEEE
jgi:hypothetical protein